MKSLFSALLLCLPLIAAAEIDSTESDRRVVGSTTVDLATVNEWFQGRKGERPMKHWKKIIITEVPERAGSSWLCSAITESREKVTIYVNNLPDKIRSYLQGVKDLDARIRDLEAQLAEDKHNREVAWNRYINFTSSDTAIGSSRRGVIADNDYTRRQTAYAYDEKIKAEQSQLTLLRQEYKQALAQAPQKAVTLAMFTGNHFGSSEIWDCGRPIQ